MSSLRTSLAHRRRVLVLIVAGVAVAGIGVVGFQNEAASSEAEATASVTRGNLVVAVGGVGRIVQQRAASDVFVAAGGGGGSGGTGATSAPPDAVYPGASGRVSTILVSPGQSVAAGDPLVVLSDAAASATALDLARLDLAIARLELKQKRTSDPVLGLPPTVQELRAAEAAVRSAAARLTVLQSPPRRADVAAARLDVRRAEADLETLLGGPPAARKAALRIARENVTLTRVRLERVLAPASLADVSQAQADLKRAQADLAELKRPQITPSPEALAAARLAVNQARAELVRAQRSGDLEQIRAAQESLESALDELDALLQPGPSALPEQLAAAEAAVDAAQKRLEKLLAPPNPSDVAAARLELEQAQAELRARLAGPGAGALAAAHQAIAAARARLAQLLGPPLVADVSAGRLELRRALADLAVLRARGGPASATDIQLAELKAESARMRLGNAEAARRMLTVRAPWSGTVSALLTVRGAPVDPATPVVSIADTSRLAVAVDLSEFDAALVRPGQSAVVSVDALGSRRFAGTVRFASPTGVNAGGVVTFPVQVALARAAGLKPGMNVSVRIVVASHRNALQVPLEAVSNDGDSPTVTVIDTSGKTAIRKVKLGLSNNRRVEIASGLRAGESVVLQQVETGATSDDE